MIRRCWCSAGMHRSVIIVAWCLLGRALIGSGFVVAPPAAPARAVAGNRMGVVFARSSRLSHRPLAACRRRRMLSARNSGSGSSSVSRLPLASSPGGVDEKGDDIDLSKAMANARSNLAEGKSPGAGLESAFDQADAAFADLIVTSMDDQGLTLDEEDVEDLAKGGTMDEDSTSKKSRGLFGDISDVFGALSGGAHIVKREDGTL